MKNNQITTLTALAVGTTVVAAIFLPGCGSGGRTIGTGVDTHVYAQVDRLARPAINEVFATVAGGRHQANDTISPSQDSTSLSGDIQTFMTGTAGRSQATTDVIKSVLVPDMLMADLKQTDSAAYLGVETGGVTGGKFGGRKLTDDVIDADLGVIFGNTVSALGLAPDDGKEIPTLATDNVGDGAKHFIGTFPYIGAPQ